MSQQNLPKTKPLRHLKLFLKGVPWWKKQKKSNYSKLCNKKEFMAKDRWVHNALSKAPHWKLLKAPQNCFPLFRTWIKQIKLGLPSLRRGYLLSQWHQEITSIWRSCPCFQTGEGQRSVTFPPQWVRHSHQHCCQRDTPALWKDVPHVASGFLTLSFMVAKTGWRAEACSQTTWPYSATEGT